jgi:RNA polymerase sigma-70 factor (ECF subfamily)
MERHAAHTGTVVLDAQRALAHLDRLYRFALMLGRDQGEAEDVVQDVVERLLRRPRRVSPSSELAYLTTMVRNRHQDVLRERFRRPIGVPLDDALELVSGRSGEGPQERVEQREILDAVDALSRVHREVIVAVDIAGLSYQEAAATLGIPVGTVMSRLYRARAAVAERYLGVPA